MATAPFRAGFVAVVGRPNVGKSTLVNNVIGNKISIVTPKPQTTRHRLLAICNRDDAQIVFVDTPGMHRGAAKAMNRLMNRAAANALADADLILFVTEATRWTAEDEDVLQRILDTATPAIAVLNKVDRVHPKEALLRALEEMAERHDFAEILPISATRGVNVDRLLASIPRYLPRSEPLFPAEMVSDRGESFFAAETIREKLTLNLRQEVPYGLTVQIETLERDAGGVSISAIIWVERESQKGIVVGKSGGLLKRVGQAARLDMKDRFGVPVHLDLWVKVKDNWANNEQDLLRLGYE